MSASIHKRAIVGHGGGGKGGAGAGTGDTRDTIRSVAKAQIVDLLSEGEVEGIYPDDPAHFLKGIYFDGMPVQNADGSMNFKGVDAFERMGTNGQTHIKGFSDVENAITVGVQVKHATPAGRTIQTSDVDSVRITLSVPSLYKTEDDGSIKGATVKYKIEVQSNGGGYVEKVNRSISGRVSSKYQRADRIDLTGEAPWDIRVTRITADHNELTIQDDLYWDTYTEIIEGKFRYPNSALVALTIDSAQFAHIPVRGYDAKGLRVRVPHGYDPVARTYPASWNGSWDIAWTNNPAWIYYDLVTEPRYGLGNYITQDQVDEMALYQIAQYCDEAVDDGKGGTEPRFVCNCYIQKRDEAYTVLQNLASCFRGIAYWGGGKLNCVQDAPGDAVALYTQANVIDGTFNYQGSSSTARHSVALVQWNDPQALFKQKIEYVEDEAAIARFGVRETEVVAFGCTSRGQAQRVGRWLLYSERLLTDTVTFKTGLEGVRARPGQVIEVADAARAGERMGGRCLGGCTKTSIKLDAEVTLDPAHTYTLSVVVPGADMDTPGSELDSAAVDVPGTTTTTATLTLSAALDAAPAPGAVWLLAADNLEPQKFRVVGITETEPNEYQITALQYLEDIYDGVETGVRVDEPPISTLGAIPDAPANLTLTEATHHSGSSVSLLISAGWDGANGLGGWEVEYQIGDDNPHLLPRSKVPHVEIPLSKTGEYTITVVAVSLEGVKSAPTTASADFDGTTLITLAAPVLTATGVADGIDLSWASVDNADHYSVERSANGEAGWSARAASVKTEHWRDPITDGAQWYYRLIAVDHFGGESAASNIVSATAKTVADGATATQIYRQDTEPTLAVKGDLWYNPSTGAFKRWNGSAWEPVSAAAYHQATAPTNPLVGDFWFNTDNSSWSRWNGTSWVELATVGADWFKNMTNRPLHMQNLIVKSDFEDGTTGDWKIGAGNAYTIATVSGQPFTRALGITMGAAENWDASESEQTRLPVRPGQRIFRAAWILTANSSVGAKASVAFEHADGTQFAWLGAELAAGNGWTYITSIITVPANAVYMLPGFVSWHGVNTDNILIGPQDCSLFASEVYRLQGGTNIQVGSFSAHWDAYSFTASRSGTAPNYVYKSAWGGGTLHSHGLDIPPYAMHTWSGLDAATDYFCSFDDIGLTGAPSAYYASENPGTWDAAPERVPIPGPNDNGSVTTMDSNGDGGGGDGGWHPPPGGGACVTAQMWVLLESGKYKRARDVARGDVLAAWLAGERLLGGKPVLNDPPIVPEASMAVTADDAMLACSLSTPFDDRDGGVIEGLDIDGRDVATWRDGWAACRAAAIGTMDVCYISLGGYAYAAGAWPGRWIVSHNTVRPVKP